VSNGLAQTRGSARDDQCLSLHFLSNPRCLADDSRENCIARPWA
jgi:hypothetical protein